MLRVGGAALAIALLVAMQAAAAGAASKPSVTVLAPRDGAVLVSASKAAAEARRVTTSIRLSGAATSVTARLNGRLLRLPAGSRTLAFRLETASGLLLGPNVLEVEAVFAGRATPVVRRAHFVVGYRASGVLTTRLRLGGTGMARLAVQAPMTGVQQLTATLNGRAIELPDARPGPRFRHYDRELAQTGRLRFGGNELRVRAVLDDGRVQQRVHRFAISSRRPIAVIGVDGRNAVGRVTTFDAAGSRLRGGGTLDPHWTLIGRPAHSKARLAAANGLATTLKPDVPGHYVVELRVGSGSRVARSRDVVVVTFPQATVPFNTIVYPNPGDPPALQVGSDPPHSSNKGDDLQVYVLERDTAAFHEYRGFPGTPSGFSGLESYLQSLDSSRLVVVTHAGQTALTGDLSGLDSAVGVIGGTLLAQAGWQGCWSGTTDGCNVQTYTWSRGNLYGGSFTIIGVKGMTPGQAWRSTAVQSRTSEGRLTGFLSFGVQPDSGSTGMYSVVPGPDPYVDVDTCADPGCSVKVGDATYPPAAGVNGLHVVVLDRTTLELIDNETVTTYQGLWTALLKSHWTGYGQVIVPPLFDDQRVFILQTVGTGALTGGPSGSQLVELLDQMGATAETVIGSLNGSNQYALIGVPDNLPWHGSSAMESSTLMPGLIDPTTGASLAKGRPIGRIDGVLQRGRTGLYAPNGGAVAGPTNNDLYLIMYQDLTPWPYAGDAALPYIADGLKIPKYPDVRSGYHDDNLDWGDEAGLLRTLTCTGADVATCGPNFDEVKAQLLDEFVNVDRVRAFRDNLLAPYEQGAMGMAPYDVQTVTANVLSTIPSPPSDDATMKWLSVVSTVANVASKVASIADPTLSSAFGALGSASTMAAQVFQTPAGGPVDTVTQPAQALAANLVRQQGATESWIDTMASILVDDYGKLTAVGDGIGSGGEWTWTDTTTVGSIQALSGSTRAAAYTALVPAVWGGYNVKAGIGQPPGAAADVNITCDQPANYPGHYHSFATTNAENVFHAATFMGSSGSVSYEFWTLAQLVDFPWTPNRDAYVPMPSGSVTDFIYGKDSTGPSGAFAYAPAWWRSTFDPPGHVSCGVGSGGLPVNEVWSQHYEPPVVAQPLP